MSVRSVFPRPAVFQSATPADRTSYRSSLGIARARAARACVLVWRNVPRKACARAGVARRAAKKKKNKCRPKKKALHNKNPPTPCLRQAPASTQKTKRKTRPAIRRSARWRVEGGGGRLWVHSPRAEGPGLVKVSGQARSRGADRTPETAKTAFFWPENCGAGPELYMENTKQSRYPIPRPGLLPGTKRQKPGTLR